MASEVSICNLALSYIGKTNITTLTEQSAEARACNQFYAPALDALLTSYPWRFARSKVSLAQVANDRSNEWAYAYQRPVECLKPILIRQIPDDVSYLENRLLQFNMPDGFPFDIEGDTIYADLSPCILLYVSAQSNAAKFPPLFAEALSWAIAARLAMPLTRDLKLRGDTYKMAMAEQAKAEAHDANEARDDRGAVSEFERSRGGQGAADLYQNRLIVRS